MIEVLAQLHEHLVDAVGNADAALDRYRSWTHRLDLGAERLSLLGAVVVVDRHVATRRGELAGDCAADAARCACDERDFSGQRACHGSIDPVLRPRETAQRAGAAGAANSIL